MVRQKREPFSGIVKAAPVTFARPVGETRAVFECFNRDACLNERLRISDRLLVDQCADLLQAKVQQQLRLEVAGVGIDVLDETACLLGTRWY